MKDFQYTYVPGSHIKKNRFGASASLSLIPHQGCQIFLGTTHLIGKIHPNDHKIYTNFPFRGFPKYIKIGILGMKIYHRATLSHIRGHMVKILSNVKMTQINKSLSPTCRGTVVIASAPKLDDRGFESPTEV
jgi:hypothetical protein